MLLCGIDDARDGMVLGAAVLDPRAPDHSLLRPGVVLDASLRQSLKGRGVTQIWVEDNLARDLDAAIGAQLEASRLGLYCAVRDNLARISKCTITSTDVLVYRRSVIDMVMQVIAAGPYAGAADSLFSSSDQLATHSTNVAYLSLIAGLHLEAYVIAEQPRLEHEHARDMSVLGLAGLLHDVGKTRSRAAPGHSTHQPEGQTPADDYTRHAVDGHQMLAAQPSVPARVGNTALNHHQRFDGNGWPDLSRLTAGRIAGPLAGRRIHIYARVVAAANALESLLRNAEGARLPVVAALSRFASERFDGWFDPLVRRALLLRIPPFAIGTDVRLSSGQRGVVVAPCPLDPCRPTVRLRTDADDPLVIELSARPELRITHALGVEVEKFQFQIPPGRAA